MFRAAVFFTALQKMEWKKRENGFKSFLFHFFEMEREREEKSDAQQSIKMNGIKKEKRNILNICKSRDEINFKIRPVFLYFTALTF